MPQNGPKMAKNDPKWPKVAQIWPKMAQEWPKMTQNGPKIARTFSAIFFDWKGGSANFFSFRMYAMITDHQKHHQYKDLSSDKWQRNWCQVGKHASQSWFICRWVCFHYYHYQHRHHHYNYFHCHHYHHEHHEQWPNQQKFQLNYLESQAYNRLLLGYR